MPQNFSSGTCIETSGEYQPHFQEKYFDENYIDKEFDLLFTNDENIDKGKIVNNKERNQNKVSLCFCFFLQF